MYIHNVNLDVNAQPDANAKPCLRLSQNENGRVLMIRIIGVDIPEGSTANFAGVKPDGNVYSKAGTVEGNVVSINEDIQMTAVSGAWNAKITVVNDGNNICTARIRVVVDASVVPGDAIPSDSQLDGIVAECQAYAESAKNAAYGSPLTANTAAGMTDQDRVYVYTGSETGYTAGHWYYYDGSAWADGGVYNAVAVQTDTTLTQAGKAADAKKTGDEIDALKEDLSNLSETGIIETTKVVNWQNGYVDNAGTIVNSTLSGYAIVKLIAGETVKIGTANSNITIIGSTQAESLAVGDTVTKIQKTTSSSYEEYLYTATVDINIVLCVKLSDYTCHFYKPSNIVKNIYDNIDQFKGNVYTELIKEVCAKELQATAGVTISAQTSKLECNAIPSGKTIIYLLDDPDNVISKYMFYVNGSSDYSTKNSNEQYKLTLNQEVSSFAFYTYGSDVVGSGAVKLVIKEVTRNDNSIETKAEQALDSTQKIIGETNDYATYANVVVNGSFIGSGNLSTGVSNRIRTELIAFKANDKIVINSGSLEHACGMWKGTPSLATNTRNDNAFSIAAESIIPDYDGYIVIVFKYQNNADLTPIDFDGSILLYNTIAYRLITASSDYLNIPDYYFAESYLQNKVNRINELAKNADDVFFFITDVHWELNAKYSPNLIGYISEKCNIPRLFDGGDLKNGFDKDVPILFRKHYKEKIYRATGNHDWFYPATGKNLYYAMDVYNNDQVGNPFMHYYYVENVQQKIRYIVLNPFRREGNNQTLTIGYDNDQIVWFSNVALNVPDDWDVIVFTHYLRTTSLITTGSEIESAIDTFNADTSRDGKILAVFQGHTHWDGVYHTSGGVPVITTTCDKYDISNEPELAQEVRTLGTINEHVFDVVVLDRDTKKFTCVRIGAPAQDNVDIYRTDNNFEWVGSLEEREVSYDTE